MQIRSREQAFQWLKCFETPALDEECEETDPTILQQQQESLAELEHSNESICVHDLSTKNVIKMGQVLLGKMDLVHLRKKTRQRANRFEKFQNSVYEKIMSNQSNLKDKIELMVVAESAHEYSSHRTKHRLMLRK